ncbi:MAG: acyl-CoA dehydrogenase family protein [Gulosibacter sp.]|uniref:acyl-CoA dehydrogenase family protein n=1 Tax=Gulosibacter sp. TaxID=2817531 RepID=UPI003F8FA99D
MPNAIPERVFAAIPPAITPSALDELTKILAASAAEADATGRLSWDSIETVHEAGLLTATVSERFGGREIDFGSYVDAYAAMGEGDPAVALVALMTSMQHSAVASGVTWPTDVYEQVLQDSAKRPVLVNTARSEPALGASERGGQLATTAHKTERGWVINGRKAFVTGSELLDWHVVLIALPDEGGLARAFVPGNDPGIEVIQSWDGIGMRASSTHDVVYREVEIPDEHLIPSTGGTGPAIIGAMFGIGLSAIYLGVARAARNALVKFLNERVPASLGAPLATVERLQDATGEVTAELIVAEEVLHSATTQLSQGVEPDATRIAATKLISTRASINVVQESLRIAGSYGLSGSGPIQRHLRDVLCARPNPPQEDVAIRRLGINSLAEAHWRLNNSTLRDNNA